MRDHPYYDMMNILLNHPSLRERAKKGDKAAKGTLITKVTIRGKRRSDIDTALGKLISAELIPVDKSRLCKKFYRIFTAETNYV